jgi:hypothetical protein
MVELMAAKMSDFYTLPVTISDKFCTNSPV